MSHLVSLLPHGEGISLSHFWLEFFTSVLIQHFFFLSFILVTDGCTHGPVMVTCPSENPSHPPDLRGSRPVVSGKYLRLNAFATRD